MFGLMRAGLCAGSPEQKLERRLLYCGTCKAMGRLFGQRTRFTLDHDAVFLGELLALLSGEQRALEDWDPALQSYNCLALPPAEEIPLSLQVAASSGLLMAEFKVADQVADSRAPWWPWMQRLLAGGFEAAQAKLRDWNFPLEALQELVQVQAVREGERRECRAGDAPEETLHFLAEPTARATGMLFGHAARIAGRSDRSPEMSALGEAFGELVYTLDAVEDLERDFRSGSFNALQAALGVRAPRLEANHAAWAAGRVRDAAIRVVDHLEELVLPREHEERFRMRLLGNLRNRLEKAGYPATELASACRGSSRCRTATGLPWSERLAISSGIARTMRASHLETSFSFRGHVEGYVIYVTVWIAALLFPEHARSARTYRECMDAMLNIILLGSLLTAPWRMVAVAGVPPPQLAQGGSGGRVDGDPDDDSWRGRMRRRRRARRDQSGSSSGGCLDCCTCCDCCECCAMSGDACATVECGACGEGCACASCEGCACTGCECGTCGECAACGDGCGACCECGACCSA